MRARLLERARMAKSDPQPHSFSTSANPTPFGSRSTTASEPPRSTPGDSLPVGPLILENDTLSSTHKAPPAPNEFVVQAPAPAAPPPAQEYVAPVAPPVPASRASFGSEPESERSVSPMMTPAPGDVMNELDRIAGRSGARFTGPTLSPNLTALLGGLLGLTVIITLGLLLERSPTVSAPAHIAQKSEVAAQPTPAEEPARPARAKVAGPWRVLDDKDKAGNRIVAGKIGKQAFLRAIQDAGLPKNEAYRAYTALKGTLNLDHCKSSDEFIALLSGREKKLIGFEYVISKEEVYQAKPNEAGHLVGAKLDLKVDRNQIRRAFAHDGKSFEESARRAGFDPGISNAVSAALRGHSALSDFKAGDRMRIIAQEVTVLGEFSRYSGIEAMEILRAGQEPRRIYYYSHPVEGGHFDTNGRAPYEGGWRKPIPDAPRTSPFNMKRMHPVLNKVMPHTGTDYGAPTGTPMGATAPGIISFIGDGGPSGNLVKVKHEGGYESGYAHMSRFVPGLKVGDRVERMQTVGYVGSTGRSTGPHLHFTMKKDGVFIDPESLNLDGMRVINKNHREAFAEVRAKYDPILDAIVLPEPILPAAPTAPESDPVAADELNTDNHDLMGDDGVASAKAPPAVLPAPVNTPAPAAAPAGKPAQVIAPSAIFLSDAELLKMQTPRDDGEVNQ